MLIVSLSIQQFLLKLICKYFSHTSLINNFKQSQNLISRECIVCYISKKTRQRFP